MKFEICNPCVSCQDCLFQAGHWIIVVISTPKQYWSVQEIALFRCAKDMPLYLILVLCIGEIEQYLAMYSGFPPRMISVPLPAIFVAMVMAFLRPLCPTISDSLSTFSGFAFSS